MSKITLTHPITAFGAEVSELSLREMVFADFRGTHLRLAADGLTVDVGDIILIAARLASLPVESVAAIRGEDIWRLVAAIVPLLLPGAASPSAPPPVS